ncbi:Male sterility protein, putative [Trypanosoma equiperdum]|uniref:Fatty acyl-CoA reductase n=2 Tax=Trypanozoon TaxID=39700 RepID=Q57TU9_TRYB2|nr:hypothetical protein, conserved [Trypanosoma brucei brucei TREU927]AAX80025.1 hypothetical protein, conserved [Trypanosoma brucei]AAZ13428.1 hypothetical protein, conserved [Trypanosoma brucei brucei TREU927]SCU70249.1 Male sterility protein, putative [Trypanosoma equiperdum]
MPLDVHEAFSRKNFFLTGGTGFMGKVLIYKIMKEFPDVGYIYVLARGKNSRRLKRYLNPQERVKLEVLSSPCFDPLRKSMGEAAFNALGSRVVAIEGNIVDNRIGLSDKDRQTLINHTHFIVHMAATVNFDERLNIAVETNTLGSLRVLTLAKECKNLEAMVHVSTCYVNYSVQGRPVEECLYSPPFDPQGMCKHILALNDKEIDTVGRDLLKKYGFPNTYTFTKFIGEQLLNENKGNCPLVIVRPSIVGCSLKEPFPGWVDALTAAGGLILTCGLGLVRELVCRQGAIADIVPVDFVVNVILKALFQAKTHFKGNTPKVVNVDEHARERSTAASTAQGLLNPLTAAKQLNGTGKGALKGVYEGNPASIFQQQQQQQNHASNNGGGHINNDNDQGQQQQQQRDTGGPVVAMAGSDVYGTSVPFIYQASTSHSHNHITWRRMSDASIEYWSAKKRHPKALGPVSVQFMESRLLYAMKFFLCREVPSHALAFLADLPEPIGSKSKRENVKKLKRALFRAKDLNRQFVAFTCTEWVFAATNTMSLDEGLSERSRSAFYYDPYLINWWSYCHWYSYGLLKHIVRDTGSFEEPEQPETAAELFRRASSL